MLAWATTIAMTTVYKTPLTKSVAQKIECGYATVAGLEKEDTEAMVGILGDYDYLKSTPTRAKYRLGREERTTQMPNSTPRF